MTIHTHLPPDTVRRVQRLQADVAKLAEDFTRLDLTGLGLSQGDREAIADAVGYLNLVETCTQDIGRPDFEHLTEDSAS